MPERIVQDIPTEKPISRGNMRTRFDEEVQVSLTQSIAQNGILVPLLGHPEGDRIVVDDGHRRLDAAKRAALPTVPMIVAEHAPTAAERGMLQLLANTLRVDLKIMEKSRALAGLMKETNWSAADVSLKLGGPSPASISKLLTLLVLPREVQDFIDAGRIPMSSAYIIATVADAAERERLIQEVLSGRLTRDRLVAQTKANKSAAGVTRPRKPRQARRERLVIPLGPGRSVALSAPTLSVECVLAWLTDLVDRIRTAGANGRALGDVVKELAANAK